MDLTDDQIINGALRASAAETRAFYDTIAKDYPDEVKARALAMAERCDRLAETREAQPQESPVQDGDLVRVKGEGRTFVVRYQEPAVGVWRLYQRDERDPDFDAGDYVFDSDVVVVLRDAEHRDPKED